MNKSVRYTILAVLACCACAKTVTESGPGDGALMSFSAYTGREVTRAAVTDVTAANLDNFKVNCYVKGTGASYFGTEQMATKSGDGFNTGTTFYWPIEQALDFFAYNGDGVSGTIGNTEGVATINYTVPDTATEDLVVSKALNCSKPETGGVQALTFSHALTKVNKVTLQAKDAALGAKYRFEVTDLGIISAKNAGTYKFNDGTWSSLSGSADYDFAATKGEAKAEFLGDTTLVLYNPSSSSILDQLVILPQDGVKFSITYYVEYKGKEDSETWYKVMSSSNKNITVNMEKGKSYNITFSLPVDGSKISFSLEAIDVWGNESLGGTEDEGKIDI